MSVIKKEDEETDIAETERARVQKGRKASKTLFHVGPTNISKILNINPIRPQPETKGHLKRKIRQKRRGRVGGKSEFIFHRYTKNI